MRILADANVPEEYVAALGGDGHDVTTCRDVDSLGPEASDDANVRVLAQVDPPYGDRQ